MNKIHKVIFCKATQTFVAVSEFAKSQGKGNSERKRLASSALSQKTLVTAILIGLGSIGNTAFAQFYVNQGTGAASNTTRCAVNRSNFGTFRSANNNTYRDDCNSSDAATQTDRILFYGDSTTGNTTQNASFGGDVYINGSLNMGDDATIAMGNNVVSGVATGVADTDAVNVAQLKAAQTHYFSVNSNDSAAPAGTNWNNDGANAGNAIAIGKNATGKQSDSLAIGHGASSDVLSGVSLGAVSYTHNGSSIIGDYPGLYTQNEAYYATGISQKGFGATALGAGAQAFGTTDTFKTGGVAIGFVAQANGSSTVGIGTRAEAKGHKAVAIGHFAKTDAISATAIGDKSTASKENAIALGSQSVADRVAITATSVTAVAGTADPASNQVYSPIADDAGVKATVKGNLAAVSVGNANNTRQITHVAAGSQDTDAVNVAQLKAVNKDTYFHTNATGTAVPYDATETNKGKLDETAGAFGINALAAGVQAHAMGSSSVSIGFKSKAQGSSSIAMGESADAQKNNSIAIGADSKAKTTYTTAIGRATIAEGSGSTAIGAGTATGAGLAAKTKGSGAVAIGGGYTGNAGANASASRAVAIGNSSTASLADSVALGAKSVANTASGVVGYDPVTGNASTETSSTWVSNAAAVSVGNGTTTTRQITSVAAGTKDTDAVNVAQLKAASQPWKLRQAGGTDNEINPTDTVEFENGTYTTATVTAEDNGVTKIKYDITADKAKLTFAGDSGTSDVNLGGTYAIKGTADEVVTNDDGAGALTVKLADKVKNDIAEGKTIVTGGTNIAGVDATGGTNGTPVTYTVNANGTTASAGSSAVTVTAGIKDGNNVTDYAIDLSQDTKDAIAAGKTVVTAGANTKVTKTAGSGATPDSYVVDAEDTTVTAGSSYVSVGETLTTGAGIDDYKIDVSQDVKDAAEAVKKGLTFTGDSGSTNEELLGSSVAVNGDSNITTSASGDAITVKLNDAISVNSVTSNTVAVGNTVNISSTGIDAGNTVITNVTSGGTTTTNAANIGDVQTAVAASAWNIAGNDKTAVGNGVNANEQVNFLTGNATTATVAQDGDNYTVQYDVDTDGTTIKVDGDKLSAVTDGFTATGGKISADTGTALATSSDIADAINKSGFTLTSSNEGTSTNVTEEINPSDTVTINGNSDAVKVTQTGSTVSIDIDNSGIDLSYSANDGTDETVSLAKGLDFNNGTNTTAVVAADGEVTYNLNESINLTQATTGDTVMNDDGITLSNGTNNTVQLTNDGLDNGGNKITNVATGDVSENSTDAVNGAQLYTETQTYFHTNDDDTSNDAGNTATNLGSITDSAGAIGTNSVTAGINATARGSEAIAIGNNAQAWNIAATTNTGTTEQQQASPIAIGDNSNAGPGGVAIGDGARAGSYAPGGLPGNYYTTAIGYNARSNAEGGAAVGYYSLSDRGKTTDTTEGYGKWGGYNPLTGGYGDNNGDIDKTKATSGAFSVGQGDTGITDTRGPVISRQITNVAAGTLDSDAVNVAQLKAVATAANRQNYFHVNDGTGTQEPGDATTNKGKIDEIGGATGKYATASGVNASALGENSIAVGYNAKVNNTGATSSIAIGDGAQVTGESSTGNGQNSMAIGAGARTKNQSAIAIGDGAVSDRWNQYGIVVGYEANAGQARGTAIGYQSNAYGVDGVAIGTKSDARNSSSIAIGAGSHSWNPGAVSIGSGSNPTQVDQAHYSTAVGANTRTYTRDSVAIGNGAVAGTQTDGVSSGNIKATAIGAYSYAPAKGSVALGSISIANRAATTAGATADQSQTVGSTVYALANATDDDKKAISATVKGELGAVSVGSATATGRQIATRQIINVAAGTADSDAVNVAQLKAVSSIANSGFNINADNDAKDNVALGETVTYTGGDGVTTKVTDNTITIDVDTLSLSTTDGKVDTPADTTSLATASDITDAINNSGFTLGIGATSEGTSGTSADELINPGDSVTIEADKNISVTQTNGKITVATEDDVTFNTVNATTSLTIGNSGGDNTVLTSTSNGLSVGGDKITNVAAGEAPTDAVNVSQLTTQVTASKEEVKAGTNIANVSTETDATDGHTIYTINAEGSIVTAGSDALTVTSSTDTTTNDTTYSVDVATTALTTSDGSVNTPTDTTSLATASDITDAINNSGFKLDIAGNIGDNSTTEDDYELINPGETVTIEGGNNVTVNQTNGTIKIETNNQDIAEGAQLPVVYTKADGTKVYLQADGSFNTAADGSGDTVASGDVIASMQNADGSTTTPTSLTNVAGNLDGAKTGTAAPTTVGTKPDSLNVNNAATVGDVLNAGWNLGLGTDADSATGVDFVTAYDTVNFVDGNGTTARLVSSDGSVSNITYDVNYDDSVFELNSDGELTLISSTLTVNDTDTVADGATATESTTTTGGGTGGDLTIDAGKNLNADLNGTTVTISTAEEVDFTSVTSDSVSVGDTVNISSDGIDAGSTTITNVAAGINDTDAVNVSQLDGLGESVTNNTSNITNNTTNITNNATNIAGNTTNISNNAADIATNVTNITTNAADIAENADNIALGLNFGADSGDEVNAQLGDTINITGDSNISTVTTDDGVQVTLNSDLTADSLTTGDTVINTDGVTISGGENGTVSLSNSGLDNGGNTITNVADGELSETSTEAVNGSQLYATNQSVATNSTNISSLAEGLNTLSNEVNELDKETKAGIAGSAAIAILGQPIEAGDSAISAGIASHEGQSAIAVGASTVSDNGKWILKGAASVDTQSQATVAGSATYTW